MPNHVRNIVKMEGITALPLFNEDNGTGTVPEFDFNKIAPMPEALKIESGSMEDIAIEAVIRRIAATRYGFERRKAIPGMDDAEYRKQLAGCGKTEEELCKLGLQYITNKVMYGATTWYGWCVEHWGTKWNSYDNERLDADTIAFLTAWDAPGAVIAQLARMYPEAGIEHWWAEEQAGCNAGYAKYGGGEVIGLTHYENDSPDAYAAYVRCWGESDCLYQDEHGNWCRRNCDECHGCD